jgi:hypothetical protein
MCVLEPALPHPLALVVQCVWTASHCILVTQSWRAMLQAGKRCVCSRGTLDLLCSCMSNQIQINFMKTAMQPSNMHL